VTSSARRGNREVALIFYRHIARTKTTQDIFILPTFKLEAPALLDEAQRRCVYDRIMMGATTNEYTTYNNCMVSTAKTIVCGMDVTTGSRGVDCNGDAEVLGKATPARALHAAASTNIIGIQQKAQQSRFQIVPVKLISLILILVLS
jgi:hypothetical protein